ncbi:EamA family transporter [Peterkaempfera bronchialis]|uniref:EamA family transporter n=1 Tax=Peterkaempfera bronchialis TaxID=2126346 RepID=A0A345SYD0_9ACTN|nr:EamA family transporter [Peterkaempfera bronchialis]AXI78735.1 EamA family transporter [Peterkaempfera bronchialis]
MSSPATEHVLPGVPAEALAVPPSPKGEPAGERGGWRRGSAGAADPGPTAGPAHRPPGRRTPTLLRRLDSIPAPLFCLLAMAAVQSGIAFSTPLFGPLGVTGTTFLRLLFAAAVLLAATRPRLRGRSRRDLASAVLLGIASAGMTLLFAGAVDRLPMGTAATIEFLGPLAVALVFARRLGHVLWALLAGGGVVLLTLAGGHGSGPGGGGHSGLDPVGLACAFGAAVCLALYILLTHRVGAAFKGFEGLAVSITVGALVIAPFGLAPAWHGLAADPHPWLLLLWAAGVAMLFPVIPYALEMTALRRLPQRVFSVVASLEPAVSAVVGMVVLSQLLGLTQALGIACVVAASAGSTLTGRGPA